MSQVFCFVKSLLIAVHQFLGLMYNNIILQLFTIIHYFAGPGGQLKCWCWSWICSTPFQGASSSSWTEFALSIIRWVLRSHVRSHVMGSVSWRGRVKDDYKLQWSIKNRVSHKMKKNEPKICPKLTRKWCSCETSIYSIIFGDTWRQKAVSVFGFGRPKSHFLAPENGNF